MTSPQFVFALQQDWARGTAHAGVMDIPKARTPHGIQARFSTWAPGALALPALRPRLGTAARAVLAGTLAASAAGGGILGGRTLPWRALAAGALLGLSGALTRAGALGAVAGLALRGFAIADEARGLQPREAMAGHNALVELPAACRGEAYSAGRQARW